MKNFEVIVIGGGIQGAGLAQASAAGGYKTLALEKTELAAGTSSKSSKLIHGGLRYLESFQLGLVRESLRERSLLLKLAPDLVRLVPFHIPIYKHSNRAAWQIRCGLSIYSLLASLCKESYFQKLSKSKWQQLDGLELDQLAAVYRYYDAQTDDIALTKAVMRSAQSLGSEYWSRAQASKCYRTDKGYQLEIKMEGKVESVHCDFLLDARGPWAISNECIYEPPFAIPDSSLVKGSHILLGAPPERGVFYCESPDDSRPVFVMPYQGKCLVGTTEKEFSGNPNKVDCSEEEEKYLLNCYQHYFPKQNSKVLDSFAGLRVLPKSNSNFQKRTRDCFIVEDSQDDPRAILVLGGKLTCYRSTAEQILKSVKKHLGNRPNSVDTATLRLSP